MGQILDYLDGSEYDAWQEKERQKRLEAAMRQVEAEKAAQPTPWQQAMSRVLPDTSPDLTPPPPTYTPREPAPIQNYQPYVQTPPAPTPAPPSPWEAAASNIAQWAGQNQQAAAEQKAAFQRDVPVLGGASQIADTLQEKIVNPALQGWYTNVGQPLYEYNTGPELRGQATPLDYAAKLVPFGATIQPVTRLWQDVVKNGFNTPQAASERWNATPEPFPGVKGLIEAAVDPLNIPFGKVGAPMIPISARIAAKLTGQTISAAKKAAPQAARIGRQLAIEQAGGGTIAGFTGDKAKKLENALWDAQQRGAGADEIAAIRNQYMGTEAARTGRMGLGVEDVSKSASKLADISDKTLLAALRDASIPKGKLDIIKTELARRGITPTALATAKGTSGVQAAAEEALARAKGTPEQAAALRPEEQGFAGNVNLAKGPAENAPLAEGVMDNPAFNQMAGQRRGVINNEQAMPAAQAVAADRSIEDWLSIKPGTALNQEQLLALRSTTEKVGNEYRQMQADMLAKQAAGELSAIEEAKVAEKALEYAALTAVRSGAAAEAGRALYSFRAMLGGEFGSQEAAIKKAFEVLGGGDSFRAWVDKFNKIAPDDKVGQLKHMRKLFEPSIWEKIDAYRYADMLSSWKTHEVNQISNAGQAIIRPIQTALAGYPKEAAADVYGMIRGIPEGLAAALSVYQTHMPSMNVSKMELGSARANALGDSLLAKPFQFVLDTLTAGDDLWKAINYSGSIHAQAYRLAKGDVAKAEELLTSPTTAMIEEAQRVAKYATYQNDPHQFVTRLIAMRNTPGAAGTVFKFFLPFVRTPANIYTRGLGMILAPLAAPVKMAMYAAKGDMRAARMEGSKAVLAASTLAGLWGLAESGNLTGQGPTDPAKRRILEEAGWQPNSIKIGGRWLKYSNLGPVSIPMAAVAAVKEGLDEGKKPNHELLADVADRVYNSMLDVSYISSLSDILRGQGFVGRLAQMGASVAGSFVPFSSALGAVERIHDPTTRAKDDPLSAVQGRIPIASKLLPAEPSVYGGTRQQGEGDILGQILLPWQSSTERTDPVANEAARLTNAGQSVGVRQFGDTYAGAKQTPEQRRLLQGEAGKLAAAYIADIISRPAYQKLDDAAKSKTLNAALGTAYDMADLQLGEQLNRDPRHAALLAWASVPQYEGVKGTPEEVRVQNYEIAQAKAKRTEYRQQYGDNYTADYHFEKDDKKGYELTQRARLNNDYLKLKKDKVDQQFNGALLQAETEGLLGAGNTVLPVGSSR